MASVYELRHRLERTLRRELPSSYLIVSGPDHPLLLRAPDLLVAGEGKLSAVFIPTAHERRNPEDLRARLILSRLALPRDTRPILIVESEAEAVSNILGSDFTAVIEERQARTLVTAVLGKADAQRALSQEIYLAVKGFSIRNGHL
jgi:hypothetical protein